MAHLLEVFLEGETDSLVVGTRGHNLGHRFQNGEHGGVERRTQSDVGIVPEGHHAGRVGVPVQHRQLLYGGLRLRQLALAAERHQHRGGADGGVEHLYQPLLGGDVGIGEHREHLLLHRCARHGLALQHVVGDGVDDGFRLLPHTVGVDKVAAEVHDGLAAPLHRQPVGVGDLGDDVGFDVLLAAVFEEGFHVFRIHHSAHTLLRFADGHLRAVKALVFGSHRVEIDLQSVGQLADGDADTARTEVVGLFD